MKDANLVRSRRKTVDPEFSDGISDERGLCSLDHHIRARQKPPVQAIEDDPGNLGRSRFAGPGGDWYRRSFFLSAQLPGSEDNGQH
jgi:hypothetical protein